jgi:histidyl-tRNA synthetase
VSRKIEKIRSVKGTRDLLPPETGLWQQVEDEARVVFRAYNFREIRTPIIEPTPLFARSVGEDTDIVTKEMFTFADRDHESLTLRPEATASVVRAYIEHSLYNEGGIQKLYYLGPMFRRERPQKGRYRQFYQIGAEVLGSDQPTIDAEVLEMLMLLLSRLELENAALLLNSVGCPLCRPEYLKALRQALDAVKSRLCADCQRRAVTNPLRVLDCKVEADQPIIATLPSILDHLGPECRQHFDRVTAELNDRGIEYTITPRLVRGLDYYTKTTFEITSGALGAQNAVLGGGRYDGLSELLGGPPTPGIGFSIGEDRLVLAMESAGALKDEAKLAVYVAWLGDTALAPASKLARELRREGLSVEIGYEPMKLKRSLGIASKLGAQFTIIIGEGELASAKYQVKNMSTGEQQAVEPEKVFQYVSNSVGQ